MEGRHPHDPGACPDELGDPLLHLAGSLVCEGDGENLTGLGIAGREQVGDPAGEHPRLARACPRDDEQRPATMLDGGPLRLVEVVDEAARAVGGDGHATIVGAGADIADSPSDELRHVADHLPMSRSRPPAYVT